MIDEHSGRVIALPEYLDLYQALAWVRFRDAEFAVGATYEDLSAEKYWGKRKSFAGYRALQSALRKRQLVARGELPSGDCELIPSPKWNVLDIAPHDLNRNAPYVTIEVASTDLLRLFPASGAAATVAAAPGVRLARRGRTKGAGSLADADAPLLAEMRQLIQSRQAFSPNEAAMMVAKRAVGKGTIESKVDRLRKRYRDSENN